ncbi:hypothetical protein ACFYUD_28025 [Nocardia tengchongensis]|uniref:hypothetical protein n=1 Tax=Nocardia tengchongensis TaxID=2055889 RepID=UPI0036771F89
MTGPYQQQPGFGGPQYGPPGTGPSGHQQYGPPVPAPMPGGMPVQPGFLIAIGDIAVSEGVINTPSGSFPLRGAVWTATDMSQSSERTPPYAIVLAILFLPFCFLGLLFLLIKQKVTAGYVQVTVNSAGRFHSAMIAVQNESTFPMVMHQVNYARSLSAM